MKEALDRKDEEIQEHKIKTMELTSYIEILEKKIRINLSIQKNSKEDQESLKL